jgi:hypothetical protein
MVPSAGSCLLRAVEYRYYMTHVATVFATSLLIVTLILDGCRLMAGLYSMRIARVRVLS